MLKKGTKARAIRSVGYHNFKEDEIVEFVEKNELGYVFTNGVIKQILQIQEFKLIDE